MDVPFLLGGGQSAGSGVSNAQMVAYVDSQAYTKPVMDASIGALQVSIAGKADKAALAYQPADSLLSDGATSSRAFYAPLGMSLAGQIVTFRFEGYVPASNPSQEITLLAVSSTTNPYVSQSLRLTCFTNGTFFLVQEGATFNTDKRVLTWTGGRAAYSGQWIRGCVVFNTADSTTNPTIEINGVDVTANFTLTTAGTPPNWMPSTLVSTYYLAGYNAPAGRFIPHAPILGTTTKAERDQWVTTGIGPDWWQYAGGNATNRITGDSYNFAGGVGTWFGGGGAVITADSANSELDVTTSASDQYTGSSNVVGTIIPGWKYRFDVELRNISLVGGATLRIQVGGGAANNILVSSLTANGIYSTEFVAAGPGTGILILQLGAGSATFSVFQPKLVNLGPIARWGLQDGSYQVARDHGPNGIDGYSTDGIFPAVDGKRRPQVRAKNVNVGTAAYLIAAANTLFPGWDIDCIPITNRGVASAVGVKVQLSDGTNTFDLMSTATIASGDTLLVYPTAGGQDSKRRLRCVATSGADNLTFNFSLRKRG